MFQRTLSGCANQAKDLVTQRPHPGGQPFQIIGIHSPEFEREKDRDRIEAKIAEFELKHPTMMDNDFSYWKSMQNRYWPTYYLIDKRGYIRHVFIGETHKGDRRAQLIESAIAELLAEPA